MAIPTPWRPPTSPRTQSTFRPMFRNPVTRFLPSSKTTVSGVIMPLQDWSTFPDPLIPQWATSVMAPRSLDERDETGHQLVIVPCAFIDVHSRLGPNGDDFVSPRSRNHLAPVEGTSTEDPMCDIRACAGLDGSPYIGLTKEGSRPGTKYALLSWPSTKCVFNVHASSVSATAATNSAQGVLFMPKAAHAEYGRMMNILRSHSQVPVPRDAEWPDYLYGNVCNPNSPLKFTTITRTNPSNTSQTFMGWMFSQNELTLQGAVAMPVIPAEILAARLNLFDSAIYNIPSYQEFLDFIVGGNWLPLELVRQAAGGKGNIGGTPAMGDPAVQQGYGQQPAPSQGYGAPAAQAPQAYGQQPAAPASYAPPAQQAPQQAYAPAAQQGYGAPAAQAPQGYGQAPAQQPAPAVYTPPAQQPPAYGAPAQAPQGYGQPAPYSPPAQQPAVYTPPAQQAPAQQAPYTPPAQAPQQYAPPQSPAFTPGRTQPPVEDSPFDSHPAQQAPQQAAPADPSRYPDLQAMSVQELSAEVERLVILLTSGQIGAADGERLKIAGSMLESRR